MVVCKDQPEIKKKTHHKIKSFYRKDRLILILRPVFFLANKNRKKIQHFFKFCDISCKISMNRKMCFWCHCLEKLKKKSKWNENLFCVNKEKVFIQILFCICLNYIKNVYSKKILFQNVWSILYYYDMNSLFLVENKKGCNQHHNILRLFDVLPNFSFTTSETIGDYYL